MANKKELTTLAHFLYEVGTLRKIARSHRQTLLTDDLSDNIASHSFRVAIIGFLLAEKAKVDPYKTAVMCLFHDVGEARSGDQNWVHKKYVKTFEDEITEEQFTNLSPLILSLSSEYHERNSKEAILAKDADLLDQILLLKEYSWRGNQEAALWLRGKKDNKHNAQYDGLKTEEARELAIEIMSQNPGDWWKNLWSSERRK